MGAGLIWNSRKLILNSRYKDICTAGAEVNTEQCQKISHKIIKQKRSVVFTEALSLLMLCVPTERVVTVGTHFCMVIQKWQALSIVFCPFSHQKSQRKLRKVY